MTNQRISRIKLGDYKATDRTRTYIDRALTSGRISYGPLSGDFEARFALLHNRKHGILSNSGTSSLQVSLQALKEAEGWHDGDEVIVPATTFVATVNIVLHNNMKPVLVDVLPDTFAIDPNLIEDAITPRTRAIIPVHPFGLPADMKSIMDIAMKHHLFVIEDSAEAMYVSTDGRSVGDWGHIACFSFYVAHLLTMGVGGISLTDDRELSLRMRSLVNHGIEWNSLPYGDAYDPSHLGRHFRFTSIGHSFRVTELEAALGLAQLDDISAIIDKRQENARKITELLGIALGGHIDIQHIPDGSDHSYMVFPIVSKYIGTDKAIEYLRFLGIETREMLPLLNQPCYTNMFDSRKYPVSREIEHYGYYVPCHQYLTDYDIHYMCDCILSLYKLCERPP